MTAKRYSMNWGYIADNSDEVCFFEEHVLFGDVKDRMESLINEHGEALIHLSMRENITLKEYSLTKRVMTRIIKNGRIVKKEQVV